jgi:hypothetical protein
LTNTYNPENDGMSRQTNVQSIDALRRFRLVLQQYSTAVQAALDSLQLGSQRTVDWLQQDRMTYWPAEVRRATDALNEARDLLQMKQLTVDGSDPPAATEERKNVHRAQQRLHLTEHKLQRTRQLSVQVGHHAEEYRGTLGKLAQLIECDIPLAVAALDRMIDALEKYAAQPVPAQAESRTHKGEPS